MPPAARSAPSGSPSADGARPAMLACRVGGRICALPLAHVAETMRPLPVEPLAGLPAYVRGLAVVRGAPIPVVDAAALLGDEGDIGDGGGGARLQVTRFVVVRAGERQVALAVEEVIGIRDVATELLGSLPPLLRAGASQAVAAVGALDAELLVVLQAARLLSADDWVALERARGAREVS